MAEPVYEKGGPGLITRIVSLVMAGIFVRYCLDSGSLRGGRAAAVPLIPLGMIWFPEMVAGFVGSGSTEKLVSRVAWVMLSALMILPALSWLVGR